MRRNYIILFSFICFLTILSFLPTGLSPKTSSTSSSLVTKDSYVDSYSGKKEIVNEDKLILAYETSASDYEYEWHKTWGGIYNDYIYYGAMAIDSSNNIYLVGHIDTTGTSNYNIVLIKCDSQGVEQWVKIWDGGTSDKGNSILIDNTNEIYVVGMTTSYADPDGDMVIIKYDSDGNQQWNFTWGGTELDEARAIVKDSLNNYYIAGETRSFADDDGDAILIKFNSNWIEQWNVTWGGSDQDFATSMEIDSNGHVCIVGGSYSTDPSPGEADVMVLKYDASGTLIWDEDWGVSWTQRGNAIAIDSNNNIYFVGHTFGNPSSSMMGHLVKYDTNGNYQWERIWGVPGVIGNSWTGIVIDSNDELFICGYTSTHGPYAGDGDAIVLSYDTSGNQNWYMTWGLPDREYTFCIDMDSKRNIYLAGYTKSTGMGGYDIFLMKYLNALGPDISVTTPIPNSLYGIIAPNFNIDIGDPDYDFTWYSLNGGFTNIYSNETAGTIDQTEWDKQSNGTVTITFYANNSLGNVGQAEVTVRKDIIAPLITINEPEFGEVFVDLSPLYNITIDETSLDSFWYSLDDGQTNYTISELTGAIDQNAWNSLSEGHITLRFYAKDEAGNVGQSSITITKRTTPRTTPPGIPGYDLIALIGVAFVFTIIIIKRKSKK